MDAPTAAVGDVAEFIYVHMHQLARILSRVSDCVERDARIASPVIGSSQESGGTWNRVRICDTVRAGTPVVAAMRSGPSRSSSRLTPTAASRPELVRVGEVCGRELRSVETASGLARWRLIHRWAHCREMPNSFPT